MPLRFRSPMLVLGLVALAARPAAAQSVSPPIVEHREKARSSFVVSNEGIFPLTVVLQVRGFEVSPDGEVTDVPLDTTRVHVKLSTLSFRLQPRQSYTVFYEATADSLPAWFNIWSGITGARTQSGLNIRLELPHVVYLNQRDRLAEGDVVVRSARWDSAGKRVLLELENTSPRIGRAQEVVATAPGQPTERGVAFPLFPNARRRQVVSWSAPVPPARVEVRFEGFRVVAEAFAPDTAAATTGDRAATPRP